MGEFLPDFSGDDGEEDRLSYEAEEFMRQGRYSDAVDIYREIQTQMPNDAINQLAYISALECDGQISLAQQELENTAANNQQNTYVLRFREMFYERREDYRRVQSSREELQTHLDTEEDEDDRLADLYFNQGRFIEAERELQRILAEQAPEDDQERANILARIGACQRLYGNNDQARELLDEALDLDPENAWIVSELAEVERSDDNEDDARSYYEEAIRLNPDDYWVRGRYANLEHDSGNSEHAVEIYEEIIEEHGKQTWCLIELAQILSASDPERARKLCTETLDIDSSYPWAYTQLAQLERDAGNLEQARDYFHKALDNAPRNQWILQELAETCRLLGRYEEAYTHLEHARKETPFDSTNYGYMANVLRSEGRSEEATAYLNKAVELDASYVWAWRELTELQTLAGHHDLANAAYEQVTTLEPGVAINDGLRAFMHKHAGKAEQALPYLEEAVEKDPEYFWAWRELIEYHITRGQGAEAETCCAKALEHLPEHYIIELMYIESLRQQNKRPEALERCAIMLEGNENLPQIWAVQSELLLPDNRSEALKSIRKACDLSDDIEYKIVLAQCLYINQETNECKELVQFLREQDIQSPIAHDLASEFAERDEKFEESLSICDEGLEKFPDQPRLVVRRARLAMHLQLSDPLAHLRLIAESGQRDLPLLDMATLFAHDNDFMHARSCVFQLCEEYKDDPSYQAQAWVNLAEGALQHSRLSDAREALQEAITRDPTHVNARVLLAVIEDQQGHHKEALVHLRQVEELAEEKEDPSLNILSLTMHIANVCERAGLKREAFIQWKQCHENYSQDHEVSCAYYRYLLRTHPHENDGLKGLQALIKNTDIDQSIRHNALHDVLLHYLQNHQPEKALSLVNENEEILESNSLQIMAIQTAFLAGKNELAQKWLDSLPQESEHKNSVRRIQIRLHLSEHKYQEAESLAETALQEEHNEEHALLLAECRALRGAYTDALKLLQDERLDDISEERLLLGACLLLELHGPEHALAWLGQKHRITELSPLAKVFKRAWPGAWANHLQTADLEENDYRTVPPYSNCIKILAKALDKNASSQEAAQLYAQAAAHAAYHNKDATARQFYFEAAFLFKKAGLKKYARIAAKNSGSWLMQLRCIF